MYIMHSVLYFAIVLINIKTRSYFKCFGFAVIV